ncbi:MAG TPA: hypothetical protein VFI73_02120 [Candidatus Nitrosopolaris sp.]|nr:hypothetical protein [Candidatus Nitrosopolaris sp.]
MNSFQFANCDGLVLFHGTDLLVVNHKINTLPVFVICIAFIVSAALLSPRLHYDDSSSISHIAESYNAALDINNSYNLAVSKPMNDG